MTFWILVFAYCGNGNMTMQPLGRFPTLVDCVEAGRSAQKQKAQLGYKTGSHCEEVKIAR